jgi:hypothetical protein
MLLLSAQLEGSMDFVTANRLAQELEGRYEGLMVAGFRRKVLDRPHDSWALDIVNPATGRMVTIDEKDDWQVQLERAFPQEVNRR